MLGSQTEEILPLDDKRFRLRLKRPLPTLLEQLVHCSLYLMPDMPERLAWTPADVQVTEMVGSGPFRFVADERVP